MYCKNCGTELPQGANVCPGCGTAVPVNIPNHLVGAILVTVFCCQVFGIISIVYAASVNGKIAAGNYAGAQAAADKAKAWLWWGFGIGLTINIIVCIMNLLPILLDM